MSLFSRKIPAREFVVVTRRIAGALKEHRDWWTGAMIEDEESVGVHWRAPILAGEALRYLSMLQLSAVACCFKDGDLLAAKNSAFLLEWLYRLLAGDVPLNVRPEIERFLRYGRPDEQGSLRTWAKAVAPLIAEPDSGQTQRQLEKWLPLIVSAAMTATYEACGDKKAARKIRTVGSNRH